MSTILFDMDGTLLDTEKWYQKAWRQAASDCGYDLSVEDALTLRSLGKPFNVQHIKELLGEDADIDDIRDRRNEIMKPWFAEREIPLKPDAKETISALKKAGHRTAIVTATGIQRTQMLLETTGLRPLFDKIVCVSMVKQGKPAPDVYLYACDQMGIKPGDAFAVEDSPNGVRSAAAAGCKVIMIPDLSQPDPETEALLWRKAEGLIDLLEIFRA